MREFNDRPRGNRGSSRRGRDSDRGYGRSRDSGRGRDSRGPRREIEMTTVICDKCKQECQVPFKPSSDKPIFCDACFKEKDKSNKPRTDFKEEFDKINEKLDKILELVKNKNN